MFSMCSCKCNMCGIATWLLSICFTRLARCKQSKAGCWGNRDHIHGNFMAISNPSSDIICLIADCLHFGWSLQSLHFRYPIFTNGYYGSWLLNVHTDCMASSDTMCVIVAPRSGPVFKSSKKPRYGSIAAGDEYVTNIYTYIYICIIFMLHIHTIYIIYTCNLFFFKFQRFRQMLSRFGVNPMDDHCGPRSGFSFRRGERVTWWVSRGPHNVSHLTCPQSHWSHLRFWIFLDIFCVLLCRLVTGWLWCEGHGSVFEGIVWILDPISLAKLKAFLELSEDAEVALHWGSAPVAGSEWQPIGRAWCVFIGSRSQITSCSCWPFSTSWHAQAPLGHWMLPGDRKQKKQKNLIDFSLPALSRYLWITSPHLLMPPPFNYCGD